MEQATDTVRLVGGTLDRYYQARAFFRDRDEEYRVLSPFIKEGLDRGEKAVHITDTDPELRSDHLSCLQAADIDVDAPLQSDQMNVLTWEEVYLRGGRFDPDAMLAQLGEVLSASQDQGYDRTRLIGHMEWALQDRPGVDRLLEYEARVNDMLATRKGPAVCVYDLTNFGAGVVVDLLRTHPMVVMGGVMRENPCYVPPDEFLRELRERHA